VPNKSASKTVLATVNKWYRAAGSVAGTFNDIASFVGTILAFLGLAASKTSGSLPQIPIASAPFPVRLVLYLLFAAGIGWMTGLLVRIFCRLPREFRLLASMLCTLIMAGFLAGLANWLVAPQQRTTLPQEFLLVLIGAMVAIRAMVENLSVRRDAPGPTVISDRSLMPLVFAATIAAILALGELGAV